MSASQTYLVIENGAVVNVVLWDGGNEWTPPAGADLIIAPANVGIGWSTTDNKNFTAPTSAEPT